jgi:putative hemolysin
MSTQDWVTAAVAVFVLLVLAALAAMADTALSRMTRSRVRGLVDDARPGAMRLVRLVEAPERWRNTLLVVVVASQLLEATVVGVAAGRFGGAPAVVVATVVNAAVVVVLAAAAPRIWATQHPERAALFTAPLVAAVAAFWPLRLVSRAVIGIANTILPGKGLSEGPWVSEEELLALAETAVAEEVIERGERDLIASIIDFGDTVVREVMVPRPDMVTIPATLRVVDAMEVAILHGYSRLPAIAGDIDDVVGLVYAKDLMRAERDGEADREVSTMLRPAHHVPETKRISELLREMQAEQFHMAVAVDEYGGTAGLVTLEDIIEELVGEIVDEYDREEPMVEPVAGGRVRVNARLAIDELNEVLGSQLPEGDWDTVGGLLFHLLGRVPVAGEWAASEGWVLTASRVQGRRIHRILVQPASCPLVLSGSDDAGLGAMTNGAAHG